MPLQITTCTTPPPPQGTEPGLGLPGGAAAPFPPAGRGSPRCRRLGARAEGRAQTYAAGPVWRKRVGDGPSWWRHLVGPPRQRSARGCLAAEPVDDGSRARCVVWLAGCSGAIPMHVSTRAPHDHRGAARCTGAQCSIEPLPSGLRSCKLAWVGGWVSLKSRICILYVDVSDFINGFSRPHLRKSRALWLLGQRNRFFRRRISVGQLLQ
jgi:hypothetical protein